MLFKLFMVVLISLITSSIVVVIYELKHAYEDKDYSMDRDVFDYYKPPEQCVYQEIEKENKKDKA